MPAPSVSLAAPAPSRVAQHREVHEDLLDETRVSCGGEIEVVAEAVPWAWVEPAPALKQTETLEFRRWFGESAIVDEEGKPLVVYHGTNVPFEFGEFAVGEPLEDLQHGLWLQNSGHDPMTFLGSHFAFEAEVANSFARGLYGERVDRAGAHGRVYPVYLRIENPFFATEDELVERMHRGSYGAQSIDMILEGGGWDDPEGDGEPGDAGSLYDQNPRFRALINRRAIEWEARGDEFCPDLCMEMAHQLRQELQRDGYDGIIYQNAIEGGTSCIVFEPFQVKSAIGNHGNFSLDAPDIRA